MNFATLTPWMLECLNCSNVSELNPRTIGELYNYAEEALHDIGGRFLLLVTFDGTILLVSGQSTYELDGLHIATIYAAASGSTLRPSTVAEMEALDPGWEEAAIGTPERWVGNISGLHYIAIYPPPQYAGYLQIVMHKHPPDLTPAAPSVAMPAAVGDYLLLRTLERARQREGEMQMPDVAQALGGLADAYEQAMQAYYGQGAL